MNKTIRYIIFVSFNQLINTNLKLETLQEPAYLKSYVGKKFVILILLRLG
jgi:hypothetical protein